MILSEFLGASAPFGTSQARWLREPVEELHDYGPAAAMRYVQNDDRF